MAQDLLRKESRVYVRPCQALAHTLGPMDSRHFQLASMLLMVSVKMEVGTLLTQVSRYCV